MGHGRIHFTAGVGQDTRPDAAFGLQDNDMRGDHAWRRRRAARVVQRGASYAFENYSTLQRSRQANPGAQFNDPRATGRPNGRKRAHLVVQHEFALDGAHECRCLYDYMHGGAQYLYVLPPDSTLAPPQQLPELRNRYHRASVDVRER